MTRSHFAAPVSLNPLRKGKVLVKFLIFFWAFLCYIKIKIFWISLGLCYFVNLSDGIFLNIGIIIGLGFGHI